MKLPSNALKLAMLCVALAVTGCSKEYHLGYGGAYQKAIKEGKTEFEARRIAEAAGNNAEEDEERWRQQEAAVAAANLESMRRYLNPASPAPIPTVGGAPTFRVRADIPSRPWCPTTTS